MGVTPVLEGLLEDEIAISMVGNHDVLIARVGLDREASSVNCVELADGVDTNHSFVGRADFCRGCIWWYVRGRNSSSARLGRMYVLALLSQMTHDGLVCIWTVSGHIGVHETVKEVAVAGLDGLKPCLLDRET
jgi:hypothetical protein